MEIHMHMMKTLLLTVFLCCFYRVHTSNAQDKTSTDQFKEQLRSGKFADEVRRDRRRLIKGLLSIVEGTETKRSVRVRAVRILGEIRASEAVPILILHIDVIQSEVWKEKTIGTLFPCVPALIKIGKPASRAVLKEFHKPMKKLRRFALAIVLAGVEGRKVGRFMLQEEIRKAKTPKERQNLQAGLKAFLSMTANERTAEELKAEERNRKRKKRP